jgi:hypothetical protein
VFCSLKRLFFFCLFCLVLGENIPKIKRGSEMKRDKYDLTDAELELIEKVSKMLGKKPIDYTNISNGQNGGIIVEIGQLNVDRFIRKSFELFPEKFNEEK